MGYWWWAVLGGFFVVWFGIGEGLALAHRKGWITLTATIRRVIGVEPHRPWQVPAVMVLLGLLGWMALHFTTGLV